MNISYHFKIERKKIMYEKSYSLQEAGKIRICAKVEKPKFRSNSKANFCWDTF